ncbi:hypothetical protein HOS55_gp106 [Pseudomonas phage PMBT3]|uniref:Uncharacterized protein n=1 Tax=Pseudomonas phage PMBT3 TaxID=2059856 RepID=A0A2I6PI28_9CAUD|nr:hypothetical protein HOS55_gp106 [Pseudomonas phage PMBT3]AUM59708.1 hypothetical protein [Pseudomonas phage PMBT3]
MAVPTGTGKAKREMIRMVGTSVRQAKAVDLVAKCHMTHNNIRDFKMNQVPSISMEKLIKHLRDFGSEVTITVDGLVLPIGD